MFLPLSIQPHGYSADRIIMVSRDLKLCGTVTKRHATHLQENCKSFPRHSPALDVLPAFIFLLLSLDSFESSFPEGRSSSVDEMRRRGQAFRGEKFESFSSLQSKAILTVSRGTVSFYTSTFGQERASCDERNSSLNDFA